MCVTALQSIVGDLSLVLDAFTIGVMLSTRHPDQFAFIQVYRKCVAGWQKYQTNYQSSTRVFVQVHNCIGDIDQTLHSQ